MVIQLDFFSAVQASNIMRKKKHVKFINNIVRNNYKTINNQTIPQYSKRKLLYC